MLASTHDLPLAIRGLDVHPDLRQGQASLLCGLVLMAHAAGAIWLWRATAVPPLETEPATIAVVMLSEQAPASPSPMPDAAARAQPLPQTPIARSPATSSVAVRAPQQLAVPTSTSTATPTPTSAALSDAPLPPSPPAPNNAPGNTQASAQANAQANSQPGGQSQSSAAPPQIPAGPKTLPASAVRYLNPPVLSYPRASRELGESGIVRLRVLVDEQGRPREVEVAKSSSYPRLDQAAVQAMRAARFQPHIEDGQARMVWVVAPLNFQLDEL